MLIQKCKDITTRFSSTLDSFIYCCTQLGPFLYHLQNFGLELHTTAQQ